MTIPPTTLNGLLRGLFSSESPLLFLFLTLEKLCKRAFSCFSFSIILLLNCFKKSTLGLEKKLDFLVTTSSGSFVVLPSVVVVGSCVVEIPVSMISFLLLMGSKVVVVVLCLSPNFGLDFLFK